MKNKELLINYLRKDNENLANQLISSNGMVEVYKRRANEFKRKAQSVAACADENDMRRELGELEEMFNAFNDGFTTS